jgi:hypothetical protein
VYAPMVPRSHGLVEPESCVPRSQHLRWGSMRQRPPTWQLVLDAAHRFTDSRAKTARHTPAIAVSVTIGNSPVSRETASYDRTMLGLHLAGRSAVFVPGAAMGGLG